jgi:DNA-binding PadR family transcriptional regulator
VSLISKSKIQILKALNEKDMHGYEIYMKTDISLGSIYEHLHKLEAGSFIRGKQMGRTKVYTLTKRGKWLLKALEE